MSELPVSVALRCTSNRRTSKRLSISYVRDYLNKNSLITDAGSQRALAVGMIWELNEL